MPDAERRASDDLERAIAPLERSNDPSVGAGRDFYPDSTTLLLMCAGMAPWPAIPRWVLYGDTIDLPVKRLFIRDVHSVWYQHGVPGFGDRIDQVAATIRALIEPEGIERLVVAGPSAGGYAALLFGTLLEADVVLSFSPQAFVERSKLHAIGDHRGDQALERLDPLGGPDERFSDLRVALPRERRAETRYEIHYGSADALDREHAHLLDALPGVELRPHDHDEHLLMRALRNSGELARLLREALEI